MCVRRGVSLRFPHIVASPSIIAKACLARSLNRCQRHLLDKNFEGCVGRSVSRSIAHGVRRRALSSRGGRVGIHARNVKVFRHSVGPAVPKTTVRSKERKHSPKCMCSGQDERVDADLSAQVRRLSCGRCSTCFAFASRTL